MANKLKVDELRAELAKRGLDTTGTKPSLVLPRSPSPQVHTFCQTQRNSRLDLFFAGAETGIGTRARKQAVRSGLGRWWR
jgi:hypothetical protein